MCIRDRLRRPLVRRGRRACAAARLHGGARARRGAAGSGACRGAARRRPAPRALPAALLRPGGRARARAPVPAPSGRGDARALPAPVTRSRRAAKKIRAAWGVADQSSGWKGREFVIQVKPQMGVATVESFSLAEDGKHLVEQLRMGGGEFPAVKLKRVYARADHPVPRDVPTND